MATRAELTGERDERAREQQSGDQDKLDERRQGHRAADQDYGCASSSVDSANPFGAFGIFEKAGFTPKMRYVR